MHNGSPNPANIKPTLAPRFPESGLIIYGVTKPISHPLCFALSARKHSKKNVPVSGVGYDGLDKLTRTPE